MKREGGRHLLALFRLSLCAALTAVLGSCQSEGLTKQELVSRGDPICKKTSEELGPLFASLFPTGNETPSAAEAAPTMQKAAELVRKETEDLTRLQPQREHADDFTDIERALERAARLTEESARLAAEGDTEGYLEKLQEANQADQDARDLLVEFGFRDCAGAQA